MKGCVWTGLVGDCNLLMLLDETATQCNALTVSWHVGAIVLPGSRPLMIIFPWVSREDRLLDYSGVIH